jgi:hypothetical protein
MSLPVKATATFPEWRIFTGRAVAAMRQTVTQADDWRRPAKSAR